MGVAEQPWARIMMKHMKPAAFLLPFLAFSPMQAQDLPDGPGKKLVEQVCSGCHGVESVTSQRANLDGWTSIIEYMVSRGATASPAEIRTMADYLAKNFGTEPAKVNVNKATAKEIETGIELTATEAEAIVKYRQDHGDFKDWEALTKVSGVDAKKLEAKKDRVSFN
jgi:competence ComEA-like helix-hairpin-helix protein